jgi:hypothetical protein
MGDAGILPADPLTQSAADLLVWLGANGCAQTAVPAVTTFQTEWNTTNLGPALTVDGKYDPLTRGALQTVMNAEGKGTAPPDCFTPAAIQPNPTPVAPPPSAAPIVIPPPPPAHIPWGALFLGVAIVAGATVVGYTFYQQHTKTHA